MSSREGEDDLTHFRTERFQLINGKWFFIVREAMQPVGPFDSKAEAEFEAEIFIRKLGMDDDAFGVKTRY